MLDMDGSVGRVEGFYSFCMWEVDGHCKDMMSFTPLFTTPPQQK